LETMDRPIDPALQRRRRLRRWLPALGALGVILILLVLGIGGLRPSVRRDRIRTARVEVGAVTATLDASGLVVPVFEFVYTAPMATRVVRVLSTPGARVAVGDTILLLDDREARRDLARLQEQVSLLENSRAQANLDLDRTRDDLATQREVKALELKSFRYEVERNRQLFESGLISQDAVRKAETDVARADIELRHLDSSLARARQDVAARLEGLGLEIAILEKDLDRAREQLERTAVTCQRAGIVTWVVPSIGAAVAQGEPVARAADLSEYRVEATLSDVLARRLVEGLEATVRSGDTRLSGRVEKVLPTVENGIVTFQVSLDEKDHPILRPNLRMDVHSVTDRHAPTLCLKRGPVLTIEGRETVYVLQGETAVRTPITIGLSNFELYEITEGLADGDEVIISDMSDYRNIKEVRVR